MEIINYLLEANLVLAVLFGAYWLLAKNETFHQLNRWILLGIMAACIALPLVHFPQITIEIPNSVAFWTTAQQSDEPADEVNTISMVKIDAPDEVTSTESSSTTMPFSISLLSVLLGIYGAISLFFLFQMVRQLFSLHQLMYTGKHFWDEGMVQIHVEKEISPFSFFHWVFLNPNQLSDPQRQMILEHERVHARQLHNIDILLGQFFTILFWFNPLAWKFKQAINQNLEYIADAEMLQQGVDRKHYQYALLSLNAPLSLIPIANHFNYSLIKNRIHMMNIKKSPDHRLLKYLLFFPLLLSFLMISNLSYAQSEQKTKPKKEMKEEPKKEPKADKSTIKAQPVEPADVKETKPESEPWPEPKVAVGTAISSVSDTSVMTDVAVVGFATTTDSVKVSARSLDPVTVVGYSASTGAIATEATDVKGGIVDVKDVALSATGIQSVGSLSSPAFDIPVKEDENVFLVIRSDADQKMLDEIRIILKKRGVDVDFDQVQFNEAGELTHIHVEVKVGDQYHGEMTGYNNGRPIEEPVVLYVMKENGDRFGISKGMPKALSSKLQSSLERLTGLLIVQENDNYIKGILKSTNSLYRAQ